MYIIYTQKTRTYCFVSKKNNNNCVTGQAAIPQNMANNAQNGHNLFNNFKNLKHLTLIKMFSSSIGCAILHIYFISCYHYFML